MIPVDYLNKIIAGEIHVGDAGAVLRRFAGDDWLQWQLDQAILNYGMGVTPEGIQAVTLQGAKREALHELEILYHTRGLWTVAIVEGDGGATVTLSDTRR